jgi:hypothetical protein
MQAIKPAAGLVDSLANIVGRTSVFNIVRLARSRMMMLGYRHIAESNQQSIARPLHWAADPAWLSHLLLGQLDPMCLCQRFNQYLICYSSSDCRCIPELPGLAAPDGKGCQYLSGANQRYFQPVSASVLDMFRVPVYPFIINLAGHKGGCLIYHVCLA